MSKVLPSFLHFLVTGAVAQLTCVAARTKLNLDTAARSELHSVLHACTCIYTAARSEYLGQVCTTVGCWGH